MANQSIFKKQIQGPYIGHSDYLKLQLYQKVAPNTQKPYVTLAIFPWLLWIRLIRKTFFSPLDPFHHSKRNSKPPTLFQKVYLVTKTIEIVFIFILIMDHIYYSDTLKQALAKLCTLVLDNADREGKNLIYNLSIRLISWSKQQGAMFSRNVYSSLLATEQAVWLTTILKYVTNLAGRSMKFGICVTLIKSTYWSWI